MGQEGTATAPQRRKATIIAGYEVLEPMGKGPLGTVYRARDTKSGKLVVFRGFHRPADADEEHWNVAIQRFRDSLEAHEKVEEHACIQDIVAYGEEGDLFWVATEYFQGISLRQALDEQGKLPLDEAVRILGLVAEGLDFAADRHQYHGDITPHNIILTDDDGVRLINYGLAHCRNKLGSPYLSPEQLRGSDGDRQSDIFGLGALLYETLAGHPPFVGEDTEAVCRAIVAGRPAPIEGVPDYVNQVLEKMMAKAPERRYRRASDAFRDLEEKRPPERETQAVAAVTEEAEEGAAPVPWSQGDYTPAPSLHHYDLATRDFVRVHERQAREKRAMRIRAWVVRAAMLGLLFAFAMHALQQPPQHRYAQVAALTGSPKWLSPTGPKTLNMGDRIDGSVPCQVFTPGQSTLVLEIKGGRIKLTPGTILTIKKLGYEAGRIRSFELLRGHVMVKVGKLPRRNSRFVIRCGPYKTLVRGTLYGVERVSKGIEVAAAEGAVAVEKGKDEKLVNGGQQLRAMAGQSLPDPTELDEKTEEELRAQAELLIEQGLTQKIDELFASLGESAVLGSLDLAKALVGFNPIDTVTTAMDDVEALSKARIAMSGISLALTMEDMDAPDTLTLDTLEELNMHRDDRDRMLKCFDGDRLLSYRKTGVGKFIIEGRAKNSKKTLIRCDTGKVSVVSEQTDED